MRRSDNNQTRRTMRLAAAVSVGAAILFGWASAALGADEPGEATGGQRPFVMVLMDSSASMEWTSEESGVYPKRSYEETFGACDPYPSQPEGYTSGATMGVVPGQSSFNDTVPGPNGENPNPRMFGPCYVWEPPCGAGYERPSWNPEPGWTANYGGTSAMATRFTQMRGDSSRWSELAEPSDPTTCAPADGINYNDFPVRMNNVSQPRHVTFKEILTGEMILKPNDKLGKPVDDFRRYGPGCWFVPRQRGASSASQQVCSGDPNFEQYPDHDDPRPHMQEVFDTQETNGLMDSLGDQIHFAVASFDSYKFPMDGNEYGTDKVDQEQTVLWNPNNMEDEYSAGSFPEKVNEDSGPGVYNLGIFQVVGPNRFPAARRFVSDISELAQTALVDSGTLKPEAYTSSSSQSSPDSEFDIRFDGDQDPQTPSAVNLTLNDGLGAYTDGTLLSRQPMAKDTPLGPAMHDIHEYFASSQSPVGDEDRFNACRPKHVLMMTDGIPLPEGDTSGTTCQDVGTEGLSTPFNKNKNKYDYACTEKIIDGFVNSSEAFNSGISDIRYTPHVHVVGLNVSEEKTGPTDCTNDEWEEVCKLGSMAKAGQTCAGWYLGDRTSTQETNCGDIDNEIWLPDDSTDGKCHKPDHPCLVEQYGTDGPLGTPPQFTPFDKPSCPTGGSVACKYPALILQCTSLSDARSYYSKQGIPTDFDATTAAGAAREARRKCLQTSWYGQALQQIFNTILRSSGLASRTKPAIANELDDPGFTRGGQYRMYSGLKIDSDNPTWGGLLFRERRVCEKDTGDIEEPTRDDTPCDPIGSNNDSYICMHEEISSQIPDSERDSDDEATEDNRRIFTSVPRQDIYNYSTDVGMPAGDDKCGPFHSTYMLRETDGRGDFQDTYMEIESSGNASNLLLDQRIPFEFDTLNKALVTDSEAPFNGTSTTLADYFGVSGAGATREMIDQIRGRSAERMGRELGAILNSNPVTVEPPKLDVPIDSYREYKAKYAQRPSMLYFGTLDGMLHAVHTGELDSKSGNSQVQVRDGVAPGDAGKSISSDESPGPAAEQREAWAYIPQMLHDEFLKYRQRNPELMDGSPVVKDVRLCHKTAKYNQNYQACRVICEGSRPGDFTSSSDICSSTSSNTCEVPGPMQWRTVLVQGLGTEGRGYFAMDVTRPGGPHPDGSGSVDIKRPDPIPLWEFTPEWEEGQLTHMIDSSEFDNTLVGPSDGQFTKWAQDSRVKAGNCNTDSLTDSTNLWRQPLLGKSVSDPAVGTVVMPPLDAKNEEPIRRPVAVFGGGDQASKTSCDHQQTGHAIYINDLQTGSVLRRFVGYYDDSGWQPFEDPIVGSPALHDNTAGSLTTRGFIGDSKGRIYRIDFTGDRSNDWDPADWKVTLFFDPEDNSEIKTGGATVGPAVAQPAIALGRDDNLVVVYGLGEPNDSAASGDYQAMIAVKETSESQSDDASKTKQGKYLWHVGEDVNNVFNTNEKITGEPVIFNRAVYFTSYYRQQNNACAGGSSRIWGLKFDTEQRTTNSLPGGVFNCSDINSGYKTDACSSQVFEPSGSTLIRGLAVTLGPSCSVQGATRAGATRLGSDDQEPQLIAQTGGSDLSKSSGSGSSGGGVSGGSSTDNNFINKMAVGIDAPRSQTIPMSWSVVNN